MMLGDKPVTLFGKHTQIYERVKQKKISTFSKFPHTMGREIMRGFILSLSLLGGVRESVDLIKPY